MKIVVHTDFIYRSKEEARDAERKTSFVRHLVSFPRPTVEYMKHVILVPEKTARI